MCRATGKLSSSGTLVGNFNPAGLDEPYTIAIDSASNVWVASFSGNSVVKLSASGALLGNFNPSGTNFSGPRGIAFEAAGNAWVSNASGNTVTELSSNGALLGNFNPSGLTLHQGSRGSSASFPARVESYAPRAFSCRPIPGDRSTPILGGFCKFVAT